MTSELKRTALHALGGFVLFPAVLPRPRLDRAALAWAWPAVQQRWRF